MRKTILTVVLSLSVLFVMAQDLKFGIQGGLNYNFSGDLKDLNELGTAADDILHGAENNVGYHGGVWLKADFQDVFLKGELLYTQYKTDFDGNYNIKTQKLDIPVVLGAKILGPVYVFAGPDFQYILDENFSVDNSDVKFDDFTLGLHLGAGLDFGKVSFDVRWDKGLSGSDSEIVTDLSNHFTLDNRPNQLLFSLNLSLTD